MNATKTAMCRSRKHADGLPWRCGRPQGHRGPHQVHHPRSRVIVKTWPRKPDLD